MFYFIDITLPLTFFFWSVKTFLWGVYTKSLKVFYNKKRNPIFGLIKIVFLNINKFLKLRKCKKT